MTTTAATTTSYSLDPMHSRAHFSIKHLMISTVRGEFTSIAGSLLLDNADVAGSSVDASIDVSSIHTGQPDRDGHLKSADFFDVATYPKITFKSKSISKTGDEDAVVVGDLTMHGVTKEVTLKVEGSLSEIKDPMGYIRIGFTAETKVNRKDYGLVYNAALEAGGVALGEEVKITLDVEFVKSA